MQKYIYAHIEVYNFFHCFGLTIAVKTNTENFTTKYPF